MQQTENPVEAGGSAEGTLELARNPELLLGKAGETLDILLRTPLQLSIRFGSARLPLGEVLQLQERSIVELDRNADGLVELIVNNAVLATGEVVSVDGNYGIRILEVAGNSKLAMLNTSAAGRAGAKPEGNAGSKGGTQ